MIGIIGVGELAAAFVDGLCNGESSTPPEVLLSPRGAEHSRALAQRHPSVRVAASNAAVVREADVLLLAVRPEALAEIAGTISVPAGTLVISALTGVDHATVRAALGGECTVVRAIPLPALRDRRSPTVLWPAHPVAVDLFEPLGGVIAAESDEELAALQASTGTISAFLHYAATVAEWLAGQGIDPRRADAYVRRVFAGVAAALEAHESPITALATGHETPGGLNEQFRRSWFDAAAPGVQTALDDLLDRLAPQPLTSGPTGSPPHLPS